MRKRQPAATTATDPARALAALWLIDTLDVHDRQERADRLAAEQAERDRRHEEAVTEQARAIEQGDQRRTQRARTMTARDRRFAGFVAFAAITVAAPWAIGHFGWRRTSLSVEAVSLPKPHPPIWFVPLMPEVVAGLSVILGLFGLWLLRPLWLRPRMAQVVTGLALVGVAAAGPRLAEAAAEKMNETALTMYRKGPIALSVLNTCGMYWTSAADARGVRRRWVLAQPTDSFASRCRLFRKYTGWTRTWTVSARAGFSFERVVFVGGLVWVVWERRQVSDTNLADALVGVDDRTGRIRWRWYCDRGRAYRSRNPTIRSAEPSQDSGSISVVCTGESSVDRTISAITGRVLR
ncbi:MAG: hypothetical protein ACKVUT_18345 [Gaiella sp.]